MLVESRRGEQVPGASDTAGPDPHLVRRVLELDSRYRLSFN